MSENNFHRQLAKELVVQRFLSPLPEAKVYWTGKKKIK